MCSETFVLFLRCESVRERVIITAKHIECYSSIQKKRQKMHRHADNNCPLLILHWLPHLSFNNFLKRISRRRGKKRKENDGNGGCFMDHGARLLFQV